VENKKEISRPKRESPSKNLPSLPAALPTAKDQWPRINSWEYDNEQPALHKTKYEDFKPFCINELLQRLAFRQEGFADCDAMHVNVARDTSRGMQTDPTEMQSQSASTDIINPPSSTPNRKGRPGRWASRRNSRQIT